MSIPDHYLRSVALRTLSKDESDFTTPLPAPYLAILRIPRDHLALYPNASNFLFEFGSGEYQLGEIVCLDCFTSFSALRRRDVPDGGVSDGVGSLEAFQLHLGMVHGLFPARQDQLRPEQYTSSAGQGYPCYIDLTSSPSSSDSGLTGYKRPSPVDFDSSIGPSSSSNKRPRLHPPTTSHLSPSQIENKRIELEHLIPRELDARELVDIFSQGRSGVSTNDSQYNRFRKEWLDIRERRNALVQELGAHANDLVALLPPEEVEEEAPPAREEFDRNNAYAVPSGSGVRIPPIPQQPDYDPFGTAFHIPGAFDLNELFHQQLQPHFTASMNGFTIRDEDVDRNTVYGGGVGVGIGPVPTDGELKKMVVKAIETDNFEGSASVEEARVRLGLAHRSSVLQHTPSLKLMPHQIVGVDFMLQKEKDWRRNGTGGMMCDAMGLGKTIQSLATILLNPPTGGPNQTLIVAPLALLEQWRREI
ncbi:hypothetical protein BT69DRAFT_1296178, partial [Atractiella rhizophila]